MADHLPAEPPPLDPGARADHRSRPSPRETSTAVAAALQRSADEVARMEKNLLTADEQLTHLRVALESNRRIGMAIGILMALRKVDEEAAFGLLRTASSHRNVKLRQVAEEVIRTGTVD
ncbi:ANTAR domain-containing protein [Geodermatophilus sp. SYSU D01180]